MFRTLFFCIALGTGPAFAQDHGSNAIACLEAVEAQDMTKASQLAKSLLEYEGSDGGGITASRAIKCLFQVTGESWRWSEMRGKIVRLATFEADNILKTTLVKKDKELSDAARALADAEDQLIEARQKHRAAKLTLLAAQTYDACLALYRSSTVEALTNPVCHQSFTTLGLPPAD